MTRIQLSTAGQFKPTTIALQIQSKVLFSKGENFLKSAVLIRENSQDENVKEFVYLHLLCQAIEIIIKSLLLFKDFTQFKPLMKKDHSNRYQGFGHDIKKLAEKATQEFNLNPIRPALLAELQILENLYTKHLLRYDSVLDFFPNSIPSSEATIKRIKAVVRLVKRHVNL